MWRKDKAGYMNLMTDRAYINCISYLVEVVVNVRHISLVSIFPSSFNHVDIAVTVGSIPGSYIMME